MFDRLLLRGVVAPLRDFSFVSRLPSFTDLSVPIPHHVTIHDPIFAVSALSYTIPHTLCTLRYGLQFDLPLFSFTRLIYTIPLPRLSPRHVYHIPFIVVPVPVTPPRPELSRRLPVDITVIVILVTPLLLLLLQPVVMTLFTFDLRLFVDLSFDC